ncbi:cyclophilin type peptidyl-prolyl cis-trans isomerase, partial [Helicosporidium sp. ATCC 50920]
PAASARAVPPPYSREVRVAQASTGSAALAFTSTALAPVRRSELATERVQLRPRVKGYARLHTSLGDLNVELHCDVCPMTCENWLALAEGGYYDGLGFHRSIRHFMIQGGDPTGTGKGGESVFGRHFQDECDARLLHSGRGVLSMANAGPNTNGSQFFVLYKSAHHLDHKHTVFGKVVGGFDVLARMELVPTDDQDRPLQPIVIDKVTVFVNPYRDLLAEQAKQEAKQARMDAGRFVVFWHL